MMQLVFIYFAADENVPCDEKYSTYWKNRKTKNAPCFGSSLMFKLANLLHYYFVNEINENLTRLCEIISKNDLRK